MVHGDHDQYVLCRIRVGDSIVVSPSSPSASPSALLVAGLKLPRAPHAMQEDPSLTSDILPQLSTDKGFRDKVHIHTVTYTYIYVRRQTRKQPFGLM